MLDGNVIMVLIKLDLSLSLSSPSNSGETRLWVSRWQEGLNVTRVVYTSSKYLVLHTVDRRKISTDVYFRENEHMGH